MMTLGEKAEMACRIVAECKDPIAYDTETSGLDWKIHQPVGYVITQNKDNNLYIPVRHGGGGNLLDANCGPMTSPTSPTKQHAFERELSKAFQTRREKKLLTVGHHIKFDMHMSANQGIVIGREVDDTQNNEAMLNEFSFGYSLDQLGKNYNVALKKGDEMYEYLGKLLGLPADKKLMEHYWKTNGSEPVVGEYAMGDGVTTLEVWEKQVPRFEEDHMLFIHWMERQLIYTIFKMERKGIKVSPIRMDEVVKELQGMVAEASAVLPRDFNARSPLQMKQLCTDAGRTDWPMTAPSTKFPGGQPSFPEAWLETFPVGEKVIRLRKYTNISNSFIDPLKETHMHNGRVHTSLNQLKSDDYGTITGRFSCSEPNLQQVPKRDKVLGKLFRSIFIPDDGFEFYEADYSQCEPRLFAHYSQDPALVAGYNASPPRDVHTVVAELLNVERDPTAKRMNMGIFTGMQIDSFEGHMRWWGQTVQVGEEQDGTPILERKAEYMFNRWFEEFSSIKNFQNLAKQLFRDRGWVRTILGRLCRLDHRRFAYRGTSRIIQGSNADLVKAKLLETDVWIEESGLEDVVQLLLTIHDSIVLQAEASERGRKAAMHIVSMMEDVMRSPYKLTVPQVVDVGRGLNWAEASYGGKVSREAAM